MQTLLTHPTRTESKTLATGAATMEINTEVAQKIKNTTTLRSCNPTSGHIAKETEISISKRYLHPHVDCGIIHHSQDMKTT